MRKLFQPFLILLLMLGVAREASAQVDAQIADLNSQALEAYQALDIDTARAKLEAAVGLAQQSGLVGPVVAQSYMNLAVLYVAAQGDRDQGLTAFISAICMQPDIMLDPLLSTPDVEQVFARAHQDAQGGACGPAPMQPGPMAPQFMPTQAPPSGPQTEDFECPPGVICDESGEPRNESKAPTDFARFFFNVQFGVGFALVGPGMITDGPPPTETGLPKVLRKRPADLDGPDINGDMMADPDGIPDDVNGDGIVSGDDVNGDGMVNELDVYRLDDRYYFDDTSPWIPDADSFDDYENDGVERASQPVSDQCAADGVRTGPLPDTFPENMSPFSEFAPSSYCARVVAAGMVPNLFLRLNPGYFITDSFALSLPFRLQFSAGKGSFANMLLGLRGELLFSEMESATGVPISWFLGATYGQIQAKPPALSGSDVVPFVISGPFGVHTGINLRIRVHRNFGFIVAPEFDLQIPNLMFNMDLGAGIEAAF